MSHFTEATLRYLKALKRNNKRPWFEAHRAEYEAHVRQPMLDFVEEMDLRLHRIAPEIVADPKRSVFRIYRDVRFSKDKSPYKTHTACWFFHSGGTSKVGREAHGGGAGFYVHIEPGHSMVGAGCWMPPRPALLKFRAAIANDPRAFERIVLAPAVKRRFGTLSEEGMLARVPRGYEADHPGAQWLRRTSFTMGRSLTDAEVLHRQFPRAIEKDLLALRPLVRWLNSVLGLAPREQR